MEELTVKLSRLGIQSPLPQLPGANPIANPIDIYRSYLTEFLVSTADVEAQTAYPAIQWAKTLDKGDLVLAVPQLRIKNIKPTELAAGLVGKVPNASTTSRAE